MFPDSLYTQLTRLGLQAWLPALKTLLAQRLSAQSHGDFEKWSAVLRTLPNCKPGEIDLATATLKIGEPSELSEKQRTDLKVLCQEFHPWRKGPFNLFGIEIDTEWRSDWKWDRLSKHITPLAGRRILDIGCGSGYHCWRMRGAGAEFVLGIDPTLLFVMQFLLLQHFIGDEQVQVLPLGIDEFPIDCQCFDTVFSMGLLYHRRDPQQHLAECRGCLTDGGELVLETLVIDEKDGELLIPQGRYAQMRNVWCVPSVTTLRKWLEQAGYWDVTCVDVNQTSTDEQRSTEWMMFQSLKDFLDPVNPDKTIEGYPAPRRAIMIARK